LDGSGPDALDTLRALMSLESRAGNREAARELDERILALTEAIHGPDSPQYAVARANLLSHEWGEPYRNALEEALAAAEAAWGPQHTEIARLRYNLGYYHESKGEYDRAKTLYGSALAIWDELLGEGHDNLAPLVQLGSIASKEGDFETGWTLRDRALRICLNAEGPRHSGTAGAVWQLGVMLEESGDYARAKRYFRRVYRINEQVWGARHPRVTGSIVREGRLESMAGRYVEARELYQRALGIREADGPRTIQVASLLNSLGQLDNEYGHPERAVPVLKRALDVYTETRGPGHDDVGWTLVNLAEAHRRLGDLEFAGELIERGLTIRREAVGDDHEYVAWSLAHQARILEDMGRIEEALEVARRATVMTEKTLGSDHPDLVWPIWTEARLHLRRNDRDAAERLFRRALLIRRTQYGENHAWFFYEQGLSEAAMGDRRAALGSLRRAVDLGFPNAASLRLEPDLAWLREDPEFEAILRSGGDSDPDTWVLPVARPVKRPMRPEQVHKTTRLVVEEWPDDEPELINTVGGELTQD